MQILATVDESDIGQIKNDQPVTFTVQAYPGQTVHGRGAAGAHQLDDGEQRRELHGGGRGERIPTASCFQA